MNYYSFHKQISFKTQVSEGCFTLNAIIVNRSAKAAGKVKMSNEMLQNSVSI